MFFQLHVDSRRHCRMPSWSLNGGVEVTSHGGKDLADLMFGGSPKSCLDKLEMSWVLWHDPR